MSHTRQAIALLQASAELLARRANLPPVPHTARMVEALAAGDTAPAAPTGDVLLELRRRLTQAARGPAGVAALAPRDLRDAPWLMWAETEPLGGLRGLLEAVLRLAERRAGVRRTLIEGWIKGFASDAPRIAEAGQGIRRLLRDGDDARFASWRAADAWCHLFDPGKGPRALAHRIVQGPETVSEALERAGLDDPLRAVSGYARAVQREVLRLAPEALAGPSGPAVMVRLSDFLAPDSSPRFPDPEARGHVARALLTPWLTGRREPDEQTRVAVQGFLLKHLGDPRIRAGQWSRAGEDAIALMRRWLARASLDAFFEVIGDHAYDKHWRYREAFWSACLEAGGIDDAWLALGSAVQVSARTVEHLRGGFARLAGHVEQSILLLRVRNTIFCEWSHNGKVRAWPVDWKAAPKLYQSSYTREDVTGAGLPFPPNPRYGSNGSRDSSGLSHTSSDRSRWQGSVARMLADRANIHLTDQQWMPK